MADNTNKSGRTMDNQAGNAKSGQQSGKHNKPSGFGDMHSDTHRDSGRKGSASERGHGADESPPMRGGNTRTSSGSEATRGLGENDDE